MNREIDSLILATLLKAQPDFASGNALAEDLGVSRVSIWSHVDQLKKEGIEIEAIRNRGYRLKALPKELHPALLEAFLWKERVASEFRFFESIDSTNSEAERELADGCPTPLVIAAGRQTKGRGRLGRQWFSEDRGNLYLSYVFRPHLAPTRMQRFTLWFGLCLCAELNDAHGLPVMMKWPNDLLCDGRKIAGILTEARVDADRTRDLVLGCGINVNSDPESWPEEIRNRATSLQRVHGQPLEVHTLAAGLIRKGLEAYDAFVAGEHEREFEKLWQRFNVLDGAEVTVTAVQGDITGVVDGIDTYGALKLRLPSGEEKSFQAGDVTLSGQRG